MKRFSLILLLATVILAVPALSSAADSFPNPGANHPQQGPGSSAVQQKLNYGYIPPAPIRHTWPGGYKVIFQELGNTLSEHILGQY